MKILFFTGCIFLILAASSWAENVYVSENIRLTVRHDPGNDKKIISILMSGDQVEVVQHGEEWSKIRLSDGKTGWVLSRFLTTQIPCSLSLKMLENKYAALVAQSGIPQEDILLLKEERQKLEADHKNCLKQMQALNESYETLKKDSSDVLKLRASYDEALAKAVVQSKKLEQLVTENEKKTFDENFKWFLTGGGVFLAGFIVGIISRRKKSYSLIR